MSSEPKRTYHMKVFQKGQVVIPVNLRKKYRIEPGDQIEVLEQQEGILLRAHKTDNIGRNKTAALFGIFRDQANARKKPTRKDMEKALEKGLAAGWKK